MPYEDQPALPATPIRRGPIRSCTKRFAALDQGRASSTPASFRETLLRWMGARREADVVNLGYVRLGTLAERIFWVCDTAGMCGHYSSPF